MKKIIFATIAIITALLSSCSNKESGHIGHDKPDELAIAIADSIYDSEELQRWIEHYDSAGDRHSALILRQKYGSTKRNASDFEEAIEAHSICINEARELCDTMQLIIAYNNQGTNFRRLGDMQEASNYHFAALELCDMIESDTSYTARKNIVRTLNGLGNVLLSLDDNEAAEAMFRRALAGEKELGSLTGMAINLANIGAIKEEIGELDSARIYYMLSLEKNVEDNNNIGISLCYQNLGNIHELKGELDSAKGQYLKSYGIGIKSGDIWHWLNSCTSLSNLYLQTGMIDSATHYVAEAAEAAEKINAKGRLPNIYALYSNIYEAKGNDKKALEYTKLAHLYEDSIKYEENQSHLHNLRLNYEIKKRNDEIEKAHEDARLEKELRRSIMWYGIAIILLAMITVIALVIAARSRKRAHTALKKADEERRQFYRSTTHQLKTPLTVIMGMTEELSRHIPREDSTAQKEFDAISRKSRELVELVTKMTEYNAGETGEINHTELAQESADNDYAELDSNNMTKEYILVAEDDKDLAFMITQKLKNNGYSYKWAGNGKVALDLIMEEQPQLLITDVMMPEMDGLELTRQIRDNSETAHLPIIIVSARTSEHDRLAGIDAGAEIYLGKPFIPDELLLMVKKMLEQREILKRAYCEKIEEADRLAQNELFMNIKGRDKEYLKKIDSFIQENITDCSLNAGLLAGLMATSTTTLNRKISNITGHSTTNYIRLRRLVRAKFLLKNTDMPMGEIQTACGFESPSYFSRAFKGEFGITPSEFRKQAE